MANRAIFGSAASVEAADTRNYAGGKAYKFSSKHQLAQYACTGTFNDTYYTKGENQLKEVIRLAQETDTDFLAKVAIYCREIGFMKDMPALLVAFLSTRPGDAFEKAFRRVITNGKMLRNFVQIMRSGVVGRKSLGTRPSRLISNWFASRTDEFIFRNSIGANPSLADILHLAHVRPPDDRRALYGWVFGQPPGVDVKEGRGYYKKDLPPVIKAWEAYKANPNGDIPEGIPFEMVMGLELDRGGWAVVAENATWFQTLLNLNTFARHGVFEVKGMKDRIEERLKNEEEISRAKVFPYRLLAAYLNASSDVPAKVKNALQHAMETATQNVPEIEGKVYIFPDVSGSMSSAITGYRRGSTSKMRCIDIAALMSSAILRKNPEAEVIPFEQGVVNVKLNPFDSVMTNAQKLASVGGGGTNCSAPMVLLNSKKAKGDLVIYISDNESWADRIWGWSRGGTALAEEWKVFKKRNKKARMVCIDITPGHTTQKRDSEDTLNIGGFSDQVFSVIDQFSKHGLGGDNWTKVIESAIEF